jgi:hypothetical protein
MSNQVAKHHRKAARHEGAARHVKHVRGGKRTRAKKPFAKREQGVGDAFARPAADTVGVMEIEVVSVPENALEDDEAEFSCCPTGATGL